MIVEYSRDELQAAGKVTLLSFVLYLLDPFSVLFAVPLHYHGLVRREQAVLLFSVIGISLVLVIREMVRFSSVSLQGPVLVMFIVGFGMPVMLAIATGTFYLLQPMPVLKRLAAVTGAYGVIGMLLITLFQMNSQLMEETQQLLAQSIESFFGSSGAMFIPSQLAAAALYTFQRSFLVLFMLQFGISFGAAWEYHKRRAGIMKSLLPSVRIPESFVWVFLVSWTVVLLDLLVGLGIAGIAGWNIALASGLLYMIQGMAIIQNLISRKRRVPVSGLQLSIMVALTALLPGLNMLIVIALGILGVTEVWIVYRRNGE